MKLLIALTFVSFLINSQAQVKTTNLKAVSLIEPRTYELDGGAFVVFGQSRVTIPIELPENTVEWYYVFSSFSNEDVVNSSRANLNLLSQITLFLDQTGTTANVLSALLAPSGSSNCSVYLFPDYENSSSFLRKDDQDIFTTDNWSYQVHGTVQAARQGKQKVTQVKDRNYYLGIRAGTSPVVVKIEVVAIVDESVTDYNEWSGETKSAVASVLKDALVKEELSEENALKVSDCVVESITQNYPAQVFFGLTEEAIDRILKEYLGSCYQKIEGLGQTKEQQKAITYGNLGWQYYESGDLEKAIEYSKKALELQNDLGYVKANLGLFCFIKGDDINANDYYIDALIDLKKNRLTGKGYLKAAIDDIDAARKKYTSMKGYEAVLKELKREYDSWM